MDDEAVRIGYIDDDVLLLVRIFYDEGVMGDGVMTFQLERDLSTFAWRTTCFDAYQSRRYTVQRAKKLANSTMPIHRAVGKRLPSFGDT